ncbi:efflux RND transporter periplasmic adaptor subunit [Lignipirellula cremea]|uniref:Cobalt-zinc-cadmium resistance protein CzcB n=1 Tax=Lignipirellula cremea TaxID=2528010 RepID=A0A518DXA1_9BACT|nr:efflux RND transporter periplasmic adaptor subunit [Lignipirellula cremea]QDU96476.1 Cobalt-zinc-cadmium resistance protein CzcB [Lignipirellula cremea]
MVPRSPGQPAAAAFLIAVLAAASGCEGPTASSKAPAPQSANSPPRQVEVVEISWQPWADTVRLQGSLLGDQQSVVGSRLPGLVERVEVDLGATVHQGDVLVELDRRELELRVAQAAAELHQSCSAIGLTPDQSEHDVVRENSPGVMLEQALVDEARANLSRAQGLLDRKIVTESEYERLSAQLKTAEARYRSSLNAVSEQIALIGVKRAELALANQQLTESVIKAPYDGVVSQRHVSPGEYVQVGQGLVTIVRTDTLRFTAGVPERKARDIQPGQTIRIELEGESQPIIASVSRISPLINASSRARWIEADVANPQLRLQAGLFARARVVVNEDAQALAIPLSAVREFAGVQKAWVVRDGVAAECRIQTGRAEADRIEILSGLEPGDLVVRNSKDGKAGAAVAVREDPAPAMHVVSESGG